MIESIDNRGNDDNNCKQTIESFVGAAFDQIDGPYTL